MGKKESDVTEEELVKRVIAISGNLYEEVVALAQYFHIDRSTIYKMAIIHGMQQLDNDYIPKQGKKRDITQKIELWLPQTMWDEFYSLKDTSNEALDELNTNYNCSYKPISDGKLIEMFIDAEVRSLKNAKERLNPSNKTKNISIRLDINASLYDEIQLLKEEAMISDSQMYKYLLIKGLVTELLYPDVEIKFLGTDLDIYYEIQRLGLDKHKAITLLRYLIKNDRIIWK